MCKEKKTICVNLSPSIILQGEVKWYFANGACKARYTIYYKKPGEKRHLIASLIKTDMENELKSNIEKYLKEFWLPEGKLPLKINDSDAIVKKIAILRMKKEEFYKPGEC